MFTGGMTTTTAESVRVDLYAQRMRQVQTLLETANWVKVREGTWQSPAGDRVRFGYSNREWRIYTSYKNDGPDMHVIPIRAEPVPVPTPDQILFDIMDIRLAGTNPRQGVAPSLDA